MSARKALRDRLDQARRENYVDLRVTTPAFAGLFVRCRAIGPAELDAAFGRHSGKDNAGVEMAIDLIASTCVGIWEEVDGKGVSPVDGFTGEIDLATMALAGELPTFSSPELAEALGLSDPSAQASVKALLAVTSDLRLMTYSDALQEFSTGANASVVRAARGN